MNKTDKIIKQYLWLTGAFNFGMSLTLATYVSYLLGRGLNLFEANLVNVAFFTTMVICEVPTGAFADTFGRKKSYVISCFLFALGEFWYSQVSTMAWFIVAEILAGVGRTFANGASHSWFVDTLKHHGYTGSTDILFRKEQICRQVVGVPGALLGGYLATIDPRIPWIIGSIVSVSVGIAAIIVMKEEYFIVKKTTVWGAFEAVFRKAKSGMQFARKSSMIRFVIAMNVILCLATQAPNMQWQPFFGEKFGSTAFAGYVWAGIALFMFIGMHLSLRFKKLVGREDRVLVVCHTMMGVSIVLAALYDGYLAISLGFFMLHEVFRGVYAPLSLAVINDAAREEDRATVISFSSMIAHAACLIGLLISGYVAEKHSIVSAWVWSGLLLVVLPIAVLKFRSRFSAAATA